ncbi:MAG: hypothetical protein QG567_2415 [Campylobacterota bacterium]|nr:hypothetical protein [Campylobacterota bacterium]
MYEQEKYASLSELEARISDMSAKIAYLDNNFNHKNFKLTREGSELGFENFLAKKILNAIRSALVHEVNELDKEKVHLGAAKKKD